MYVRIHSKVFSKSNHKDWVKIWFYIYYISCTITFYPYDKLYFRQCKCFQNYVLLWFSYIFPLGYTSAIFKNLVWYRTKGHVRRRWYCLAKTRAGVCISKCCICVNLHTLYAYHKYMYLMHSLFAIQIYIW